MDQVQTRVRIEAAIEAYNYPAAVKDFTGSMEGYERKFSSMRELESYLRNLLLADSLQSLKDGLAGILYWGHYNAGYRDRRVAEFRKKVTDEQLERARQAFPALEGASLIKLKNLRLPQFTNMAFVTKLRTFLDPEHYCVLDRRISDLAPLAERLKRCPTYIPITRANEVAYTWWVDTCRSIGSQLQVKKRPVDVERGFFYLMEKDKAGAEQLLEGILRA